MIPGATHVTLRFALAPSKNLIRRESERVLARATMSNFRKRKLSPVPSAPLPITSNQIHLVEDVIIYMAKFLSFPDYKAFIRSLWPAHNESDGVRKTLWKLSTYKCETKFIDGKQLEIEYNFDATRPEENRILINTESLLPVFGGIISTTMDKFASISKLENFVRMHVHLNMCSDRRYASCPCHLVNDGGPGCEEFVKSLVHVCGHGHFHHYCSKHVESWLKIFENNTIQLHQTKVTPACKDIAESSILSLDDVVFLRGVDMHLRGPLLYKLL
ncbi:repeat element protein-b15.1 [Ichnoviriform fugitivi]|uniref:Repeat element protein-b15.1 n=1 Tax=Ichnoviriform fugitivi TaxID=265522 RepID=A2Q0F1_9VIRU|nr:repeat element protein-b15.1 [Ichnoviriform fugitivi]BAF45666.1 repeat element protein-b15.1 [Ichnoviriform fugitivi]